MVKRKTRERLACSRLRDSGPGAGEIACVLFLLGLFYFCDVSTIRESGTGKRKVRDLPDPGIPSL